MHQDSTTPTIPDAPAMTAEEIAERECRSCHLAGTCELRDVELPIEIGTDTVLVRVRAAVCSVCGDTLLDIPNAARLEEMQSRIKAGDLADLRLEPVGTIYRLTEESDERETRR